MIICAISWVFTTVHFMEDEVTDTVSMQNLLDTRK